MTVLHRDIVALHRLGMTILATRVVGTSSNPAVVPYHSYRDLGVVPQTREELLAQIHLHHRHAHHDTVGYSYIQRRADGPGIARLDVDDMTLLDAMATLWREVTGIDLSRYPYINTLKGRHYQIPAAPGAYVKGDLRAEYGTELLVSGTAPIAGSVHKSGHTYGYLQYEDGRPASYMDLLTLPAVTPEQWQLMTMLQPRMRSGGVTRSGRGLVYVDAIDPRWDLLGPPRDNRDPSRREPFSGHSRWIWDGTRLVVFGGRDDDVTYIRGTDRRTDPQESGARKAFFEPTWLKHYEGRTTRIQRRGKYLGDIDVAEGITILSAPCGTGKTSSIRRAYQAALATPDAYDILVIAPYIGLVDGIAADYGIPSYTDAEGEITGSAAIGILSLTRYQRRLAISDDGDVTQRPLLIYMDEVVKGLSMIMSDLAKTDAIRRAIIRRLVELASQPDVRLVLGDANIDESVVALLRETGLDARTGVIWCDRQASDWRQHIVLSERDLYMSAMIEARRGHITMAVDSETAAMELGRLIPSAQVYTGATIRDGALVELTQPATRIHTSCLGAGVSITSDVDAVYMVTSSGVGDANDAIQAYSRSRLYHGPIYICGTAHRPQEDKMDPSYWMEAEAKRLEASEQAAAAILPASAHVFDVRPSDWFDRLRAAVRAAQYAAGKQAKFVHLVGDTTPTPLTSPLHPMHSSVQGALTRGTITRPDGTTVTVSSMEEAAAYVDSVLAADWAAIRRARKESATAARRTIAQVRGDVLAHTASLDHIKTTADLIAEALDRGMELPEGTTLDHVQAATAMSMAIGDAWDLGTEADKMEMQRGDMVAGCRRRALARLSLAQLRGMTYEDRRRVQYGHDDIRLTAHVVGLDRSILRMLGHTEDNMHQLDLHDGDARLDAVVSRVMATDMARLGLAHAPSSLADRPLELVRWTLSRMGYRVRIRRRRVAGEMVRVLGLDVRRDQLHRRVADSIGDWRNVRYEATAEILATYEASLAQLPDDTVVPLAPSPARSDRTPGQAYLREANAIRMAQLDSTIDSLLAL